MGRRAIGAVVGIVFAFVLVLGWWVLRLRPESMDPAAPVAAVTTAPTAEPATPPPPQPESKAEDSPGDAKPAASIVVSGSLRDTFGDLVDATEERRGIVCSPRGQRGVRFASFPAVGAYRVEGLAPGDWILGVGIRGYEPQSLPFSLAPELRDLHLDLVLTRHPRVRVVIEIETGDADTNQLPPFGLIRPIVQEDPEAEWELDVEEDVALLEPSGGNRRIDTYTLALHRPLPAHVSVAIGDRILDTKEVTEDGQEIRFVVGGEDLASNLGTVRFTVIDSHGQAPTYGGHYLFRRFLGDGADEGGLVVARAIVRLVQPGPVTLEIRAPDHAARRIDLAIQPGVEIDLGEIRLEPELTIRGRLSSPDGSLMDFAAARLECIPLSGDWRRSVLVGFDDHPTTGTEGRFTIRELQRGRYALRARNGHLRAGPIEVSTESGAVENVSLRVMETAEVEIRFPDAPEDRGAFAVEDAAGLPVAEGWIIERMGDSLQLVPGHYRVRVVHEGKEIASEDFTAVMPNTKVVLERR